MDNEYFVYSNKTDTFSVAHRKAYSHIMPENHFHGTFQVFYLVEGERSFFIKDGTFKINEGDLVLLHPNVLHRTTNSISLGHESIIVNFHKDELTAPGFSLSQILHRLFENEYTIISFTLSNRMYVEELLNKILREVQQQKTGFEMYSQALTVELLIYCCRFMEQNSVKKLLYPGPTHEKITEIVRYINKNYACELDLHILAETFYISPFYLSRAFKEVTGFTFIEYLNNLRIKEAKKLLVESRKNVETIAKTVGYGSRTHFGRVFRQIEGRSPLQYRKIEGKS